MLKSSILWAKARKVGPFRDEANLRFGGRRGGSIQKTSCMAATRGDLMSGEGAAISTVPSNPRVYLTKCLLILATQESCIERPVPRAGSIHHGCTAGWCHRYCVLVICAPHPQEAFGAMSGREAALSQDGP